MASRNADRVDEVICGTGNVFADLGYSDAAERQAKLRLAYALNHVLDERKLTQAEAAKVLGLFGGTIDDAADRARPGCRDRDQAEASIPESSAY